MITTSASRIHTVEPRIVDKTRQLMISVHGVIDILQSQPFHFLISSFSAKAVHLHKDLVVLNVVGPTTSAMTASSSLHHHLKIGTPESLNHYALRDARADNCKAEHNTALTEALRAKHENVQNLVGVVQSWHRIDRESQIDKYVGQKQNATAQLKKNWSKKVAISAQYHDHQKNHSWICSPNTNSYNKATLATATLQCTAWSRLNQTKHQYNQHHIGQALRLKNLRWMRLIKCSRKTLLNKRKLNGQHPISSCPSRTGPHALPQMDECIDLLGKATVFSKLDSDSGYWQIKIEDFLEL